MYDELVKRLRHSANFAERGLTPPPSVLREAADAIENMSEAYEKLSRHMDDLAALMPRWIPVTERLPEENVPVLVTFRNYYKHSQLLASMLACIYCGVWCYWDDEPEDKCRVDITHWMPLPEPPKEGRHEK